MRLASSARDEIKFVAVQWTNHRVGTDDPFRQWSLPVRAMVLSGEDPPIALPENGDLLSKGDKAGGLARRNLFNTSKIQCQLLDGTRRRFRHEISSGELNCLG